MKHRHKARRIVAALLSLTLCCSLALGTPLSAGAAELPTQRTEASPTPAPSTINSFCLFWASFLLSSKRR